MGRSSAPRSFCLEVSVPNTSLVDQGQSYSRQGACRQLLPCCLTLSFILQLYQHFAELLLRLYPTQDWLKVEEKARVKGSSSVRTCA